MKQKFKIQDPQDPRSPGSKDGTNFKDPRAAGSYNKMNVQGIRSTGSRNKMPRDMIHIRHKKAKIIKSRMQISLKLYLTPEM